MAKIVNIGWKDLKTIFRDAGALVLLILTPFGLTLVFGFAFGGFGGSGSDGGLQDIPVVIVNRDGGQFGEQLIEVFGSEDLADLVEPVVMDDEARARVGVDDDVYAAAVLIPEGLSERIIPMDLQGFSLQGDQAVIEVYANPTRPVSSFVVRSIVDRYLATVSAAATGARVSIEQLIRSGRVGTDELSETGEEIGRQAAESVIEAAPILIEQAEQESEASGFDWLTFTAPSMAILFLMFTVTAGGRSILAERDAGTLPRMLVTPSTTGQVLGGKIVGIFFTGLVQVSALLLASWLLLGLRWGDLLGVVLLTLGLVWAASGWGALVAASSPTPGRANSVGTALALIFGAAAGNFVPRQAMPEWLQNLSYISPNAWGLEGFADLTAGAGATDLLPVLLALLLMGAVLFVASVFVFRRQFEFV